MVLLLLLIASSSEGLEPRVPRGGTEVSLNASRLSSSDVDCFAAADEAASTARLAARALAALVRCASEPLEDFGTRALAVAAVALESYDEATAQEVSSSRIAARQSLSRVVGALLAPAHAEHVAMLRAAAVRALRAQLADVDDFVSDSASIAARTDLAFRDKLAAATPQQFHSAWESTLEAAYDALQDDFREAFADFDLHHSAPFDIPHRAPPAEEEEEEEEEEDARDLPRTFLDPMAKIVAFLRPRALRIVGIALNILQAQAAIRAATRAAERRDTTMPKLPLF